MGVATLVAEIDAGGKAIGGKLNHSYLKDKKVIAELILKQRTYDNLLTFCSRQDLLILYFRLTGYDYRGVDSKPEMARNLIAIAKEMREKEKMEVGEVLVLKSSKYSNFVGNAKKVEESSEGVKYRVARQGFKTEINVLVRPHLLDKGVDTVINYLIREHLFEYAG